MKNFLKKETKNILNEVFGVQTTITKEAKVLAKETFKRIQYEKENIEKNKSTYFFENTYLNGSEFEKKTNISQTIIRTILYKGKPNFEDNEVGGSFLSSELKQHLDNDNITYEVKISVHVYNWDNQFDLTKEISKVLSHELLHAFDEIKRLHKSQYTKMLYGLRNMLKADFSGIIVNNAELKEFLNVFYLHLPQELNARTHQLYLELESEKDKTYEELVKIANKTSVFRDLNKLSEYHTDNILKNVPEETLKRFINEFVGFIENNKEKYNLKSNNLDFPKEPEKFFKFWEDTFHKGASHFRNKLLKLIKNIKQIDINENTYNLLSEKTLNEILPREDEFLLK
jgi:hypothetical protein